jgi:glycosyltransferase involved in cell wall biosynthesis
MIADRSILSISPFPAAPLFHGAIARIHYLNAGLAASNRLVFVYRGEPNGAPPGFPCAAIPNSRYRPLQIFNPLLVLKLWRLTGARQIDLIVSNHIWSGLHGAVLATITGKPFLFDNHNVEFLRIRRMSRPFWPLIWLLEWAICQAADKVLCVSETDRHRLIHQLRVKPGKIDVVPNGVDVAGCVAKRVDSARLRGSIGLAQTETLALFFGTLDYLPNATAAEIIVHEIAPRLERLDSAIRVIIAGRCSSPGWVSALERLSERVSFVGFVDDIAAYIKSADVVIVPLTMGSGTRFKILESVGCGRRVVSTTIGAEGLNRDALGDSLVVHDDWDAFARAIVETAKQPPLAPSVDFVQRYDWRHIVDRLQL